ncbi:hypothetical protein K440DRAFT_642123 [Wilcoxina mikolae CBS 423.85]|nr:hypothetical protein K440DRAFT_642123 [Wilcoxina mikolae CBS 423.85]
MDPTIADTTTTTRRRPLAGGKPKGNLANGKSKRKPSRTTNGYTNGYTNGNTDIKAEKNNAEDSSDSPDIAKLITEFITKEKPGLKGFYPKESASRTEAIETAEAMYDTLIASKCPRRGAEPLTLLALYDLVILIDDSLSMKTEEKGSRKKALEKTLKIVSWVYTLARPDGIVAIKYLNAKQGESDVMPGHVKKIIKEHKFQGWTRIGTKMKNKVFDNFVKPDMKKPLLVITITDGDVFGEKKGVLVSVIDKYTKSRPAVAFQFARVGNDEGAAKLLQDLNDDHKIGYLIDCCHTPIDGFAEEQKWDLLPKLLAGGVSSFWDEMDTPEEKQTRTLEDQIESISMSDRKQDKQHGMMTLEQMYQSSDNESEREESEEETEDEVSNGRDADVGVNRFFVIRLAKMGFASILLQSNQSAKSEKHPKVLDGMNVPAIGG